MVRFMVDSIGETPSGVAMGNTKEKEWFSA